MVQAKYSVMKYFTRLLWGGLFLLLFSTCEKEEEASISRITQGTFFCECFGECLSVAIVTERDFEFSTYQTCSATSLRQRDCAEPLVVGEFQQLSSLVDWDAFREMEEVIGCPDCADGGGQWIEISRGGEVHRVEYEFGDPPTELAELVEELSQRVVGLVNAGC